MQPNQYVEGSKDHWSERERSMFKVEKFEWPNQNNIVGESYIRLRKEIYKMKYEGLKYYDFTMLFKYEKDTVYDDPCCHLFSLGSKYMADEIVNILKKEI